jgi:rubrerythrin
MPDFATAFTPMASERKLSRNDLVRAIRLMVADEYEAISVYTQLADSIDNELAKAVLLDIADEEKVHAGEFLRLLSILSPDEAVHYAQGTVEVDQMAATVGSTPAGQAGGGVPDVPSVGSLKR